MTGGEEDYRFSPQLEEADVIEVENVEEQELAELQSNYKKYSALMESRFFLMQTIANLLRRPCHLHQEVDCPIKNTLYYKIDIIEILITDLHILAIKLNEVHKIKRERQEQVLKAIYDKCF